MAEVPIGIVSEIWLHRVKGMKGFSVREDVQMGPTGLSGNRNYAFLRKDVHPDARITSRDCLTGRDYPGLVLYGGRQSQYGGRPSGVEVIAPDGKIYPVQSEELLERLKRESGEDNLELRYDPRGIYDQASLSLLSMGSLEDLQRGVVQGVDIIAQRQRFREDLIVSFDLGITENDLLNKGLALGANLNATIIRITGMDPRCVMVDINPIDGISSKGVLKAIGSKDRKDRGHFGVYAEVLQQGPLTAGNRIYLLD